MGRLGMARHTDVWTKKKIDTVTDEMELYIAETAIPILAEFAYKNDYNRSQLYQIAGLSNTIKKMMLKKEAQLEKLALSGNAPTAMCIFGLKQLGWSDKQEIKHAGEIKHNVKWGDIMGGEKPETE